jgi:hypothetical protein
LSIDFGFTKIKFCFQAGSTIKVISFEGLRKVDTIDITQDVINATPGSGYSNDPNYDKYEDLKYIERRLKLEPGEWHYILV